MLTKGGLTYTQFVETLRVARPHIQRAIERRQRLDIQQKIAKATMDREKMFEEGSRKMWLKRVLGKGSKPMRMQHCWIDGGNGVKKLCNDAVEIMKSVDKHFYAWTSATKERDDSGLLSKEMQEVYSEKKSEKLWHIPTKECPEGDEQFMIREPSWAEFESALKCMGKGKATGPTGHSPTSPKRGPRGSVGGYEKILERGGSAKGLQGGKHTHIAQN